MLQLAAQARVFVYRELAYLCREPPFRRLSYARSSALVQAPPQGNAPARPGFGARLGLCLGGMKRTVRARIWRIGMLPNQDPVDFEQQVVTETLRSLSRLLPQRLGYREEPNSFSNYVRRLWRLLSVTSMTCLMEVLWAPAVFLELLLDRLSRFEVASAF